MTEPKFVAAPDFETWKAEVDRIMSKDFAIDTIDAGIGEEQLLDYWQWQPSAAAFVGWFAEKYDLDPISIWR